MEKYPALGRLRVCVVVVREEKYNKANDWRDRERKKGKMMHDRKKTKNQKKLIVVLPLDLLVVVVVVAVFMNEGAS